MTTLIRGARKIDVDGEVDDFWMLIEGDTIIRTGSDRPPEDAGAETVDLEGARLVPGFIDLHCHGGGGHSFGGDRDSVRAALASHRAHGTTRSILSLVTAPIEELEESLRAIAELRDSDPTILGAHLEGPFLSAARRGAHDEQHLVAPTGDAVTRLMRASTRALRYVTIAPELPGALDAITAFREAGVAVGVGHTEADYRLARDAFDRGATLLTHAFNAMPGIHHREPGPVVAALNDPRVTLELVLDGWHVHDAVAAATVSAAPGRVTLVTDAMAAAGAEDGNYRLGSLDVTVTGGRATVSGTETIAGSTLTQDAILRRAVTTAGVSPIDAVTALTHTPARALGLEESLGRLAPGFAADAVTLDDAWRVTAVWAAGQRVGA